MNWQRGLFRFWLVVSIVWGLAIGWWSYVSFQTVVGIARSFGVTGSDWMMLLAALALPIVIGFGLCVIAVWILRGFRA